MTPEKETPTPKTVEEVVASLVKLAHPYDQGKPTEILEQELRQTLLAQNQAARTAGYQAAVADLSGKPLTAIELMYDEAYARGYKEAEERLRGVVDGLAEQLTRPWWQELAKKAKEHDKEFEVVISRISLQYAIEDIKTIAAKHGITNL